MLAKDKITEIYCIADDFCKEFDAEIKKHRILPCGDRKSRNRPHRMSDSEMSTILICFHYGTFRNFKHFYLFYISEHLKKEFSNQLSYNRFIQIEHQLFAPFVLFLKLICFGECAGITFVDSTSIAVCKNKRIKRNKVFKGMAEVGKSTVGWFYGFKPHLVCNDKGELINFCLTKGNWESASLQLSLFT